MPSRLFAVDLSALPWPPILSRLWALALLLGLTLGLGWSPPTASATGVGLLLAPASVSARYLDVPLAQSATSRPTPYFNNPDASGPVEPTSFAPAAPCCLTEYVRQLIWHSWGGPTATATGEVVTRTAGVEGLSPATVTLGGLSSCAGQPVYSSYTIEVAPGARPGVAWTRARHGSFACRFSAGNYRPSKHDALGGCVFFGKKQTAWVPYVPKLWLYEGLCRMHWVGFASGPTTTTGKGVLRTGFTQWGVKATLSQPAWCHEGIGDAIAYTRLTMTIYGKGEPEGNGQEVNGYYVSAANADRLRATIGKPGFRAKTYRYTQSITEGCVALSSPQAQPDSSPSGSSAATAAVAPINKQIARDAEALAARIRAAARRGGRPGMTATRVMRGCCGVRAVEVMERAKPSSRYGVYYLGLVTGRGGRIEKVTLSEDTTGRAYRFWQATHGPLYDFTLAFGAGHWQLGTGHAFQADDHYTTGTVGFHDEEARLTLVELHTLYTQALAVLSKAERHAPVSQEAYLRPGLPCGLPEDQACEPGGRW